MSRFPPLDRWQAPAQSLPGPHSHIALGERRASGGGRVVYAASDQQHRRGDGQPAPLIVECVFGQESVPPEPDAKQLPPDRYTVDLSHGEADGWPPHAVVTRLPTSLPPPYERFQIVDFIGVGGMGQVWLARDQDTPNLTLAIKFLRDLSWNDPGKFLNQFRQEAETGIELSQDNRHFVQTRHFLHLGESVPTWPPAALVMEYVGVTLATVIDDCRRLEARLPPQIASEIAIGILAALQEVHRNGRAHRDIKPSNIMLRLPRGRRYVAESLPGVLSDAHAVLSDLGTLCPKGAKAWFLLGQDGWKAPEMFLQEGPSRPDAEYVVDPAEDMYAFGLVLKTLAEVVEQPAVWLTRAAEPLTQYDAPSRPRASDSLRLQLAPHWDIQLQMLAESGWKPDDHADFVGREFVFEAFERFRAECRDHGGMFLVVGEAGVGKTALLTRWVSREGPHPAFFYRYREGRTTAAAMPEALVRMLCHRYEREAPQSTGGGAASSVERLESLLRQIAEQELGPAEPLLLVIDGLDEAANPLEAAQMLPKSLPRGVFCIVASRPPAAGHDHVALLVSAGARRFDLKGDDEQNLRDGERFFEDQLARAVDKEQRKLQPGDAARIARNAGGTFQLLRYWVEDILAGRMAIGDVLERPANWAALASTDRLFAWYQESWQRIMAGLTSDERGRLVDFACLMAAAQAPLGEQQMLAVLGWRIHDLDWAKGHLAWLLVRTLCEANGCREAYLQLRHQSINDFLTSVEHGGPARYELAAMHARLGNYSLDLARRKGWQQVDPYGRFFAVRHLLEARSREEVQAAVDCLTDLEYLQATLGNRSPLEDAR